MNASDACVVLGGGVSGLVAGLLLKRRFSRADVVILEVSGHLGGAMRGCFRMGEDFDLGTHIPQETGIPDVDLLIEKSVHPGDLLRMPSSVGDLAGTFSGRSIHLNTSYPDLLHADPAVASEVVRHVVRRAEEGGNLTLADARSAPVAMVAEEWFGEIAAKSFILPLASRLFGDPKGLSGFALEVANLTWVCAANAETWSDYSHLPWFRARVAFPNQRELPERFRHSRKSLYARNGGSATFVEGLISQCVAEGVKINSRCNVTRIDLERRLLDVVANTERWSMGFSRLVSTLGPSITAKLLGADFPSGTERVEYRLIHHVLKDSVPVNGCYFYDHDQQSPIFRVTNYRAFSDRMDDRRLTTEILSRNDLADDQLVDVVESRLLDVGLVEDSGFLARHVDEQSSGFPIPTTEIFLRFGMAAQKVDSIGDSGFVVGGVGSGGTAFFQNEVIRDLYSRLDLLG